MKKAVIILTCLGLSIASCTRTYICECTYTDVDGVEPSYTSESELTNTKQGAIDNCDYLSGGQSYSGQTTYDVNCEILD